MFRKKEKGYTPWTARKAPMFSNSLNASYIKVSAATYFGVATFIVGVVISPILLNKFPLNKKILSFYTQLEPQKLASVPLHAIKQPVVVTPVAVTKITPVAATPLTTPIAQPGLVVPAIPMGTAQPVIAAPTNVVKISADEILKNEYGLNSYDAILYVKAAKDASQVTGIDASLLLALAAKVTKFQMFNDKKYVGVFSLNPAAHPTEVKKLDNEKMSFKTIDGSFRFGAEVLLTYRTQSGGDLNAALTKFISSYKKEQQPVLSEVIDTRAKFDNALHG